VRIEKSGSPYDLYHALGAGGGELKRPKDEKNHGLTTDWDLGER
jgi:hypothetical protein